MNAKATDSLYTSPLPESQGERWEMVVGLMDHLIGKPGQSSIVSRTLTDPDNGSYAINEGMDRVSTLLGLIKTNPRLAAVPDSFRTKAEKLIESDAYHTMVLLHSNTRQRPGIDHYANHHASVIMALTGPDSNHAFWAAVPTKLPVQWEQTKVLLAQQAPIPSLRPSYQVPALGRVSEADPSMAPSHKGTSLVP